jgi:phosphoribosylanthranilate isomerase
LYFVDKKKISNFSIFYAMVKVKICCISTVSEAKIALNAGADALGLVGPMPSGPGILSLEKAATIVNNLEEKVETFFLTSEVKAKNIFNQHKSVNATTIQMVDKVEISELIELKTLLPNVKLVYVIHVIDEKNIKEAEIMSKYVDHLLLDSGNPNLQIKELGGTGRTHNWYFSKEIVSAVSIPVYLAGGLNANNVKKAIQTVKPYGIDVCSGVRTNGNLNFEKINDFFRAIKSNNA